MSKRQARFGWIGLGNMGLAMATNLHKHLLDIGAPPLSYTNRTMSRGDSLQTLGAHPCASASELAEHSDIVFISMSDDTALTSITTSLLSSTLTNKIIVDTSTVHPNTTTSIFTSLTSAGAALISAPVFGATPVALQGRLLFALAGPSSAIAIVKPYIEACLARQVIVLNTVDPAKATMLKTAGNFITAALTETVAEAHVFAEKTGLGSDVLDELIAANYGEYMHGVSRKMVEGVYLPPRGEKARSSLELAVKDVKHGLEVAGEVGVRLRVAEVVSEHLGRAREWKERNKKEEGVERELDSSAVYGVVRVEAGLRFESEGVQERDAAVDAEEAMVEVEVDKE